MKWNYLSIPKLQQWHSWNLGIDNSSCFTVYWSCGYLSMLVLKLIHVSKPLEKEHVYFLNINMYAENFKYIYIQSYILSAYNNLIFYTRHATGYCKCLLRDFTRWIYIYIHTDEKSAFIVEYWQSLVSEGVPTTFTTENVYLSKPTLLEHMVLTPGNVYGGYLIC